jgi:hypothetical protein
VVINDQQFVRKRFEEIWKVMLRPKSAMLASHCIEHCSFPLSHRPIPGLEKAFVLLPYRRAFSNLHEGARRLYDRSSSLTLLYTAEGRSFYMSVWSLNGRKHSTSLKVAGTSRLPLFKLCCKKLKRKTKSGVLSFCCPV